jgi:hypothetical protein
MMPASLVIAVYYYAGHFYLPTCVRSLTGIIGFAEPLAVVPEADQVTLVEEIALRAIASNATWTNADFRTTTDNGLIDAMRLPNRQAFFTRTRRWAIVEEDGAYTLIPFMPARLRGVVEDPAHAVPLNAATFAADAAAHLIADRLNTQQRPAPADDPDGPVPDLFRS